MVGLTAAAVEAGAERAWDLTKLIAADRALAGEGRRRMVDPAPERGLGLDDYSARMR